MAAAASGSAAAPPPPPEWWGSSLAELTAGPASPQSAIVTFSQAVDLLLAGGSAAAAGVPLGQVTELCGLAGSGKTQMALQLCLDVQIPALLGGCGGGAVFVDAEGGLLPCRLAAMAAKVEEHMGKIMDKDPRFLHCAAAAAAAGAAAGGGGGSASPSGAPAAAGVAPEALRALKASVCASALLANVACARVTGLAALTEAITEGLPALLRQRAAAAAAAAAAAGSAAQQLLPVKLVVVDSLAFHFRATELEGIERTRRLAALGAALTRLAQAHDCAVVVTNHMVTQRSGEVGWGEGAAAAAAAAAASAAASASAVPPAPAAALAPAEALAAALDPDTSRLAPALGDAWAHFPSLRLHLKWDRGVRCAVLCKGLLAGGLSAAGGGGGSGGARENGAVLLPPAPFVVQREGIRGLGAKRKR